MNTPQTAFQISPEVPFTLDDTNPSPDGAYDTLPSLTDAVATAIAVSSPDADTGENKSSIVPPVEEGDDDFEVPPELLQTNYRPKRHKTHRNTHKYRKTQASARRDKPDEVSSHIEASERVKSRRQGGGSGSSSSNSSTDRRDSWIARFVCWFSGSG
jgi:hypothetical protein